MSSIWQGLRVIYCFTYALVVLTHAQAKCSHNVALDFSACGLVHKSHHSCLQDFSQRRHLLRLWIAPPVERPLPDAYLEIYGGSVDIGNRGGIKVAGYKPSVPLEAE